MIFSYLLISFQEFQLVLLFHF